MTIRRNAGMVAAMAAAKTRKAICVPNHSARTPIKPAPTGIPLATIAIAWSELLITGEAVRLKRCAEHACAWVFRDVSRNRSRRWCSMRVCGNRTKARRYAAKQATGAE